MEGNVNEQGEIYVAFEALANIFSAKVMPSFALTHSRKNFENFIILSLRR